MMNHKTSIVFTGDIGFDKHMAGKWEDDNLLSPAVSLQCFGAGGYAVAERVGNKENGRVTPPAF